MGGPDLDMLERSPVRLELPRLNPRMLLLGGSAVIAAAVVAFAIVGWWPLKSSPRDTSEGLVPASTQPTLRRDLGWLEKAMQECEEQATRKPDAVVFLVIPLLPADNDFTRWERRAITTVGIGGALLPSKEMIDGVTTGALVPYLGHFKFLVTDLLTQKTYTWPAANGVFQFSIPDAPIMENFFLSFQLIDNGGSMTRSRSPFPRQKASCYWTSLVLANTRTKL